MDAVEEDHFGIRGLGLFSNELLGRPGARPQPMAAPSVEQDQGEGMDTGTNTSNGDAGIIMEATAEERQAEERALNRQVQDRLPALLNRNRLLSRRIRRAALNIIAPARVILNALPPSDEMTAQRIISDVSSSSQLHTSSSGAVPITRPFPILDLPREVLQLVVRHCSGDPYALSERQWGRVRAEAGDRASAERLRKAREAYRRRAGVGGRGGVTMGSKIEEERVEWEVREWWLREMELDKWERDRPG